jgi:hypothetical protein
MQSLFLINGDWMLTRARSLALALDRANIADDRLLAAEAIRRITGREPTAGRLEAATRFLAEQRERLDDGSSTLSMSLTQRMPQREGRAAVIDPAMPAAVMTVRGSGLKSPGQGDAAAPSGDAAAPTPTGDGGAATGIRVYRVNPPTCVRDPSRERLGASAHGYFGTDRIELEVRNIRHGCTPGPTFTAVLEGTTLHVRYDAPTRVALARCGCRHDQFLQIVGVPRGDYEVDVSPLDGEDAGAPIATGRITARAQ